MSFFVQQTTDLSVKSLQQQKDLASHPQLRLSVKRLVVNTDCGVQWSLHYTSTEVGLSNDEVSQAESDLKWLHAQQSKQKLQTVSQGIDTLATIFRLYGTLDTIDLDAYVVQDCHAKVSTVKAGNWRLVFIRALEIYKITTSAIAASGILLKTLFVFRDTLRCSVASFDITSCFTELEAIPGFTSAFSSLEKFAISFSTRAKTRVSRSKRAQLEGGTAAITSSESDDEDSERKRLWPRLMQESGNSSKRQFPWHTSMLRQLPKLDALDLHMFRTLSHSVKEHERIFEHVANDVKLPLLAQVSLRGVQSSHESLLKFLENHPLISYLSIEEMKLSVRSWEPVIKRICQLPGLKKLRLSNLFDEQNLFNLLFEGDDWRAKYVSRETAFSSGRGKKVHTCTFGPVEIELILNGMVFEGALGGRDLGSPELMRWSQIHHLKYSL
ncbi:uncharacterized protein RCO7_07949 [Rhynchosporium graminicola]|uniref:Uncharacterized protein n=1 Tax=Rhynchosporium graminicola TaxID=2792576 RepID=A0A1E1KNS8_9HELO|nr:uncharacterized protein RCO7_07949 [Rhynchosporium commune]